MATNIVTPALGESVSEATIAKWYKNSGDVIKRDELLVELETDKVTLEVNAPSDGVLTETKFAEGDNVKEGDVLGAIDESASAPVVEKKQEEQVAPESTAPISTSSNSVNGSGPAARKIISENNLNPQNIVGTGKGGRITKSDAVTASSSPQTSSASVSSEPREERVRMTKLRQVIAKRLKDSQNTAAILTTFNEIDMGPVMELRKKYKEKFEKVHGVKLGFMSFFTKAAIAALKELPAVNAEIDGDEIVYKNHYDIGMAVGTPQGLVVPVLRDADQKSFAQIEKDIVDFGKRAKDGKLAMNELQGGTFTISNGGVYGSLLSTPIINPPQSGILGLHKIEQRAVVVDGEIKARPMMYVALSYDHRIIDGREAVTFLVKVKEFMEDTSRLLLEI